MHNKNLIRTGRATLRKALAACVLICLIACNTNVVLADFLSVGDVTSSLGSGNAAVDEAGGTADDLIIGDTGTGGLLADGVAPFIGTLTALESNNAIVGNQAGSIGAANIEDFLGTSGNWSISGDLVVGNAGLGLLDFLNAAGIGGAPASTVGGTTYVGGGNGPTGLSSASGLLGDPRLGEGVVRINGLGSRLNTEDLIVGGAGVGVIEASGRSVLNTLGIVEVGSTDNALGSSGDGTITLTDLGTRWTANAPVTVGGLATSSTGLSHGKIVIANQAVFQVDDVSTSPTASTGALTINPRGRVELAGGTLRMLPQPSNIIINNGLILGDGFIDGGITNGATGEIRNAAGVANEREYLLVSEAVTNNGTIESLGGEMEFEALVENNLEIIARDAVMRFNSGLTNTGTISIGGDTTLHGNITGGDLFVLSDSESLLNGDLTFSAGSILALSIGEDAGTLDVTGTADLTGAIIDLDYSAGIAPVVGDSYQIFQANGGILGVAPGTMVAASNVLWEITQPTTDSLFATFNGAITVPIGADLNGDGMVNALDMDLWRNNYPIASGAAKNMGDADGDGDVDGADFMKIQRDFGILPVPPITANTAAVPEPSTLALALLTLAFCPRRRRRS